MQQVTIETVPVRDDAGDLHIVGRVLDGRVVAGVTTERRSPLYATVALDDARQLAVALGLTVTHRRADGGMLVAEVV